MPHLGDTVGANVQWMLAGSSDTVQTRRAETSLHIPRRSHGFDGDSRSASSEESYLREVQTRAIGDPPRFFARVHGHCWVITQAVRLALSSGNNVPQRQNFFRTLRVKNSVGHPSF